MRALLLAGLLVSATEVGAQSSDAACAAAGAIACAACASPSGCNDIATRMDGCDAGGAPCSLPAAGAAPPDPAPLLDISGLAQDQQDYFPVITLILSSSQRQRLMSRDHNEFNAQVMVHEATQVGDSPQSGWSGTASIGLHGKGTLGCQRKSAEVNLPEKVRIAGKKMKKMILISACQDDTYTQMISTMHIAQKLNLWKSFFHWVEMRWSVNGNVESRGVYIMNQRMEDKLEDEPGNTVVLRKNYGMNHELKRPDSESEARTEMETWRELFQCDRCSSGGPHSCLEDRLNLKQYMRWIALMDVLQGGDYVDEVYFYNSYPPGVTGDARDAPGANPPLFWDVHPWDFDDMFQRCHSGDCNQGVMDCFGNAFPLFYCAQSPLDGCLHEDPVLYDQYKATVRELLQAINPPAYRRLQLDVGEGLMRWMRSPGGLSDGISDAMERVDGHRNPWSSVVSMLDQQESRHQMLSGAAEFTTAGSVSFSGGGGGGSSAAARPSGGGSCAAMSGYDVCDGDSCKRFISGGMTGRSCSQYCSSVGLHCTGAWEERDNSCAVEEEWTCDQTTKRDGGTTSDLICRCASSEPPPPPGNIVVRQNGVNCIDTPQGCGGGRSPPPPPPPPPPPSSSSSEAAGNSWVAGNSPYIAEQRSVQVPPGETLGVEGGVRALFGDGQGVFVSGALVASGRVDASIEFGPQPSSAECAAWNGIDVAASSTGLLLRYAWLVGASTALTVQSETDAPMVVESCAFDDWQTAAISYNTAGPASLVIRSSTFRLRPSALVALALPAGDSAAVAGQGPSVIEECVFARSSRVALQIEGTQPTISSNTFLGDAGGDGCEAPATTLRINEVVASQTRVITDRRGDYEDYVELFNPTAEAIDLSTFTLAGDTSCDEDDTEPKDVLVLGGTIRAGGYMLVWADDDRYQGRMHAPFKLSKRGQTVRLFDGAAQVDSLSFPQLEDDQAYGRQSDGCGAWGILPGPSPGRSNFLLLPAGESPYVQCMPRGRGVAESAQRGGAALLQESPARVAPPLAPLACGAGGEAEAGGASSAPPPPPPPSPPPSGAAVAQPTRYQTDCTSADVNSDGRVAVADLLMILSAFGQSWDCGDPGAAVAAVVAAADVNDDCEVAVADILMTLSQFGQTCFEEGEVTPCNTPPCR